MPMEEQQPSPMSHQLARILDDLMPVPGTKMRIGIDPLLSLIPWAGSAAGFGMGTLIFIDAIRLRAPLSVLARMGFNTLLDWLLGNIPFIGAIFDLFYRANVKNLKLLNRTIENREQVRDASLRYWIGVIAIIVVMLGIVVGGVIFLIVWGVGLLLSR